MQSKNVKFDTIEDRTVPGPNGVRSAGQILLSPPVGTDDNGQPFPSRELNARKSILTKKSMASFAKLYTGNPAKYVRAGSIA